MRTRSLPFLMVTAIAVAAASCGGLPKMAEAPMAQPSAAAGMVAAKEAADEASPNAPQTWKRSQLASHTVRVAVGDDDTLPVKGMQAQVRIDGFRARVVLDYLFTNNRGASLEGNFQMRLPNEASPYYMAFGELKAQTPEIAVSEPKFFTSEQVRTMGSEPLQIAADRSTSWFAPKEARMVPKEKAAFAYTSTVQRRVDPAIMEWAGAGVFNARVFPLDPGKAYRVVVGYDVNLVPAGNELVYEFDVPREIPEEAVDISVADVAGAKVVVTPDASIATAAGRKIVRYDRPNAATIRVRLSGMKAPLLAGTDQDTGAYFATNFKPDLPASPPSAMSRNAVFLVDTSLSSNPDRFNIWRKLLRETLRANRNSMRSFAVLFFGVDRHWWRPGWADNTPENLEALMSYASGLALEGATDLGGALDEAMAPAWQPVLSKPEAADLFLLSDGAATWGESDVQRMSRALRTKGGPLFAYQTGTTGTDTSALTLLARESGGAVFSVVGEAEVAAAAVAHRTRPYRLVETSIQGATDVLMAGRPRYVYPNQTLTIAGRGTLAKSAEAKLVLERDGVQQVVLTRLGPAIETSLAPRVYGQIAVAQLEELGDATEQMAKPYATHFRVTGRTCSLLMLDSAADYARFQIVPEADAYVVQSKEVAPTIRTTLEREGRTLGDPKAATLAWLAKLEHTPGMTFRMPASLRAAVEAMPASSFQVPSAPLMARQHARGDLPPQYAAALARHDLEHDQVEREAARRAAQAGKADGLKALSSLVEESPGDAVLARDVGYSAMEFGLPGPAYHLFRRVAVTRPYEPQNYRAMAQSLAAMGSTDLAIVWFEVGLVGQYDSRFGEFRRILAMDYVRFLKRIERGELKSSVADYARSRLANLRREETVPSAELVVMITWNTDATDVDLHVLEPTGEDCFYANRNTRIGGSLTQDVTQGYGPEMYVLRNAKEGQYQIRAHYFASDRARTSARTKVYATVFENWGRPSERVFEKVVTLEVGKEIHDILRITKGRHALQIAR